MEPAHLSNRELFYTRNINQPPNPNPNVLHNLGIDCYKKCYGIDYAPISPELQVQAIKDAFDYFKKAVIIDSQHANMWQPGKSIDMITQIFSELMQNKLPNGKNICNYLLSSLDKTNLIEKSIFNIFIDTSSESETVIDGSDSDGSGSDTPPVTGFQDLRRII